MKALLIAGHQSPVVTMAADEKLHRFIAELEEARRVVALVWVTLARAMGLGPDFGFALLRRS